MHYLHTDGQTTACGVRCDSTELGTYLEDGTYMGAVITGDSGRFTCPGCDLMWLLLLTTSRPGSDWDVD